MSPEKPVTLKGFLALEEPWKYDFKFLKYNNSDAIERFWAYKYDQIDFDCDRSDLTMEIQCKLCSAESYRGRYFFGMV